MGPGTLRVGPWSCLPPSQSAGPAAPLSPAESAPGSPRAVTPVPAKTEEVSNLKTLPKGLSASLPELDSENWIEVKKRPRPSPARPKVGGALGPQHVGSLSPHPA